MSTAEGKFVIFNVFNPNNNNGFLIKKINPGRPRINKSIITLITGIFFFLKLLIKKMEIKKHKTASHKRLGLKKIDCSKYN